MQRAHNSVWKPRSGLVIADILRSQAFHFYPPEGMTF